MEWGSTSRIEIINYSSKITTPKKAREYLRACLDRIELLERANHSFGESFERFIDQLPDIVQAGLKTPDELESPNYPIIEKGGKQPPNPPPLPRSSEDIPGPPKSI